MKIIMVEGRYKGQIDLSNLDANILPKRIGLTTTVQFLDYIDEIKQLLNSKGKEIFVDKMQQKYEGQLLGCDHGGAEKIKDIVDAFLYIGTGVFHPLGIAIHIDKEVFCYDPLHAVMSKIDRKQVERYNAKRKGAYLRFLEAKEIGFLVSMKPGQNNFKKAIEWKNKLNGKNCYIFVFDTLDFNQIENFPFVECWVNTACSRILDDYDKFPKPLVDLSDIEKMELIAKAELIEIKAK
ncbi:diphthamide synthesis protein [Candidatus Woesearchaeota archaeon]|nr:diphthamide synthesis protein [Candidatus Woesearchaeota archaeon]